MPKVETVQQVPLNTVIFSQDKVREAKKDHDKYADLTRMIQDRGVLVPILLRPLKKEQQVNGLLNEGVDGCQRYNICLDLKMTHIPAFIREMDDDEALLQQYTLNEGNIPMTPQEKAVAIRKYMGKNPGLSQDKVARLFGCSQPTVSKILRLTRLRTAIQEIVLKGVIPMDKADRLGNLPQECQDDEAIDNLNKLDVTDFALYCKARKALYVKAQKEGGPVGTVEILQIVNKETIKNILARTRQELKNMKENNPDFAEWVGRKNMIEELCGVDAATVEKRKAVKAQAQLDSARASQQKKQEDADAAKKQIAELEATAAKGQQSDVTALA